MSEYQRLKKMKEKIELAARSDIEKDRDALKAENKRLRDAIKSATDQWCIKPECRCFLCEIQASHRPETKTKEEE